MTYTISTPNANLQAAEMSCLPSGCSALSGCMYNSRYSKPLTGDPEKDKAGNRTKRMFNDPVGLAAAQNLESMLVQAYNRDTGEKMWDISAPVYLDGEHWGAFRVGYSMS